MRERWKKVKGVLLAKDEDLSPAQRRAFLAVNLAFMALLLWMIWIELGCPLPTMGLEFRRLERTHLLPRSEIVFQSHGTNYALPLTDGPEIRLNVGFVVGLREDGVTLYSMERYQNGEKRFDIVSLPRGAEPVLVPLLREGEYLDPVAWQRIQLAENHIGMENYLLFLLPDVPADTARAELTIRDEDQGEEFSGGGWQMEDGSWMLCLDSDLLGRRTLNYEVVSYTLTLYRADGTVLLEREGDFLD